MCDDEQNQSVPTPEAGTKLEQAGRKHVSDEPEPRSVMRELLGDELADRYEIAPGRWHCRGRRPSGGASCTGQGWVATGPGRAWTFG